MGRRKTAGRAWMRRLRMTMAILLVAAVAAALFGYREAVRPPVVVGYDVPAGNGAAPALRVALLSDTHAGRPDMPPERLSAVVDQVNALKPDVVLLAGDYVKWAPFGLSAIPEAAAIAPFSRLRARMGVFAVLGNNDCARQRGNEIARLLTRAGVRVLRNETAMLPGLTLLGTDDVIHCRGNIGPAKIAFARETGARGLGRPPGPVLLLTHEPVMAHYAPRYVDLVVAGHTHGGQMFPAAAGRWSARQTRAPRARGLMSVVVEGRQVPLLITSGVGTNNLPLRIGVPPEIVLLTLGR